MDTCPHCGEHLREDVQACPHCGSDFETGWNPDREYYSLELPEDEPYTPEDEPTGSATTIAWQTVFCMVVLLASAFAFLATVVLTCGTKQGVTLAVLLGASCYWFFLAVRRQEV